MEGDIVSEFMKIGSEVNAKLQVHVTLADVDYGDDWDSVLGKLSVNSEVAALDTAKALQGFKHGTQLGDQVPDSFIQTVDERENIIVEADTLRRSNRIREIAVKVQEAGLTVRSKYL
jgi:hypothetical protein